MNDKLCTECNINPAAKGSNLCPTCQRRNQTNRLIDHFTNCDDVKTEKAKRGEKFQQDNAHRRPE